ncbi:NTF2-related export protein 2, partial [Sarcoptes scabiei]
KNKNLKLLKIIQNKHFTLEISDRIRNNMCTTMTNTSSSLKIRQACESGKKFAEVFYEKLDKNRHTMGQLFHESAILVWNGNNCSGKNNILEFYGNLPTIDTTLSSIDAQPLSSLISQEQTSIMVTCNGRMAFNKRNQCFMESFILTAENNVWKIVTDTFRTY